MNAEVETNSETGNTVPDDAIVTWEGKAIHLPRSKAKNLQNGRNKNRKF
jgi:hypothetical protein